MTLSTVPIEDIAAERQRQISEEGWTPEHDDRHSGGQIANAAACYAASERVYRVQRGDPHWGFRFIELWPWSRQWDKRGRRPTVARDLGDLQDNGPDLTVEDRRRELVKAGALVVAEIERLDRMAARGSFRA